MYMDSDKEATRGMIVERYLDKDNAFLAVHKTSETFLEFRKELQKMQTDGKVKLDGESYQEGIGYM
jgi:quinol monooxygenase YgiN